MIETLTRNESPWQVARGLVPQLRDLEPNPDTLRRLLESRGCPHVLRHPRFPVDLFNAITLERWAPDDARAWEAAARALQEAR